MPESYWVLLHSVVFLAALLQTATGFGFAMISVPVLLIVLNSSAAIQVGMILSLLIALLLMPSLWKHVDKRLLRLFVVGSCLGIPVGVFLYVAVNLGVLKLLAGLVVMLSILTALGWVGRPAQKDPATASFAADLGVGVASGIMNASLEPSVLTTSLPATLAGLMAGRVLVSRITQKSFIRIILVLLVSSMIGLFIDAGWTLLGVRS